MTAAVQEPASLERQLGTVGEAMTRAVAACHQREAGDGARR
jgi:hypothetical protein